MKLYSSSGMMTPMLTGSASTRGFGKVDSTMTWEPPQPARHATAATAGKRSRDRSKGSRDMSRSYVLCRRNAPPDETLAHAVRVEQKTSRRHVPSDQRLAKKFAGPL